MPQFDVFAMLKSGREVTLNRLSADSKEAAVKAMADYFKQPPTVTGTAATVITARPKATFVVNQDEDTTIIVPKESIDYLIIKRAYQQISNERGGTRRGDPLP